MEYLNNETYWKDIKTAVEHTAGFEVFLNKSVLILGATGLIGSFITDCFLYANEELNAEITIYAVSRNIGQLRSRFGNSYKNHLHLIEADVTTINIETPFDYIINAAGYGHPEAFRKMPVEVLLSNVIGTQKALEAARINVGCRILYVSSGEVQNQVNHLLTRACYPVGKKAAETLCISYYKEYGVDVVIARPCHTFGANITENDNRAAAQFIISAARGSNIAMYSAGEQVRSFSYVADCASGLLTVLAKGRSGAVYGISAKENCSVKEFADKCAAAGKCRVELHVPNSVEMAEVSPFENQIVNNDALTNLGWHAAFSIEEGIAESIKIIRERGEV